MLGKWNKSVILSYIGLSFSVLGVFLIFKGLDTKYSIVCFMYAGICDLFDGQIARKCKRTEQEKRTVIGKEDGSQGILFSFS